MNPLPIEPAARPPSRLRCLLGSLLELLLFGFALSLAIPPPWSDANHRLQYLNPSPLHPAVYVFCLYAIVHGIRRRSIAIPFAQALCFAAFIVMLHNVIREYYAG